MAPRGQADKGDRLVIVAALVEGPSIWIAGNHSMTLRERLRSGIGPA